MYCCACCKHFRDKEGNDGYCIISETDVRLEDVCDAFKIQGKKKKKGGSKMTNREWLSSLTNETIAKIIHQWKDCNFCMYEKTSCKDCEEGIAEWLNAKHEKLMPEIKAGDLVFYGKESYKELKPCSLVELARTKRTQSIEKLADEVKQKITEQIMSATENGYSYTIVSNLDNDEARLIQVWLINEGFNADTNTHSTKKSIGIMW